MIARYRALFSTPGVSRLLVSSVVGRLPSGMFSLAILLFVHGSTGSFLVAGSRWGRSRWRARRSARCWGRRSIGTGRRGCCWAPRSPRRGCWWRWCSSTQAGAPVAAIVALAALAGGALPPIGGCVRALWSEVAHGGELETAYALDATTQETIWTLGPLLVGLTAGFASPAAAVLLCAALTVVRGRSTSRPPRSPAAGARIARRAHAGERAGRQPQPARAALHGRARGGGDRGGRGGAARAGGAAGRALVLGPAARAVQPRQHDRRPDLLRQELGACRSAGATA